MQLDTFTARILVEGGALWEYDVEYETPTRATCWVASEEGKSFGIHWKCHEEQRVIAFQGDVKVDGISCGRILNAPGVLGDKDDACFFDKLFDDEVERSLVFSRAQPSDDDYHPRDSQELPGCLGEIVLEIERGDIVSQRRPPGHEPRRTVVDDVEVLPVCFRQGTVHRVGFGPEKVRKLDPIVWDLRRNSQPAITFVFRYLPLSGLRANGIAPRPASFDLSTGTKHSFTTVRSPHPLGNSNASQSELSQMSGLIQKLTDRVQDLEAELKRLRDPQADSANKRKSKRVKRERTPPQGFPSLLRK